MGLQSFHTDLVMHDEFLNNSRAILDYDGNGFSFGQSLYMRDQFLSVYSGCRNYENNLNTHDNFIIEEIEVFSVVQQ